MTAARLLRLYPPAWRARYGDEFLATVGDAPLSARNVFDIVMVAIDAWLSADVRNATRAWSAANGGGAKGVNGGGIPMLKTMLQCGRTRPGVTMRDGLIGAGVMIGVSLGFSGVGILAHRFDWPVTSEMLKGLAFPLSFTLSMPWWLMKGTPRKAQAAIVLGTTLLLVAMTWIATKI